MIDHPRVEFSDPGGAGPLSREALFSSVLLSNAVEDLRGHVERFAGAEVFTDHPLYETGIYRCRIGPEHDPQISAESPRPLRMHTDMSLLPTPPEITAIRKLHHSGTGGMSCLLHLDDAIRDVEAQPGGDEILARLRALTPVELLQRPLTVPLLGEVPRIWEGLSPRLTKEVAEALRQFLAICEASPSQFTLDLTPGQVVLFSNRHFLHGRTAVVGTREVEVCLASFPAR